MLYHRPAERAGRQRQRAAVRAGEGPGPECRDPRGGQPPLHPGADGGAGELALRTGAGPPPVRHRQDPVQPAGSCRHSGTAARRPHPHGVHRASAGRHPGAGGGVLRWRSGAGRGHHLSVTQKDAAKAASCSSYR